MGDSPQVIEPTVAVSSVTFSPNGRCLALGRDDGNVTLYAVDPDSCVLSFVDNYPTTGANPVVRVRFSPDGSCLAALLADSTDIFTFDDADSCTLNSPPTNFDTGSTAHDIAFAPNEGCLAIAQDNPSRIAVFPVNNCVIDTMNAVEYSDSSIIDAPRSVSFSANGTCLAVGNLSIAGASVFTVDSCTNLTHSVRIFEGQTAPLVAFSLIGDCLAVYNFTNGFVTLFNVGSECNVTPSGIDLGVEFASASNVMSFSPNGHCFAIAGQPLPNALSEAIIYMFSTNIVAPPVIVQAVPQCNGTVTVTGTATPGLTVQILVDEVLVGDSVVVGANGTFEATVGPISLDTHTVTAMATNTDTGCSSTASNAVEVIIAAGPTITNLQTTCLNTVIVSGTGVPGIPVSIFVDDNPTSVGMGLPNDQGIFLVATQPVSTGVHCFTAVQAGCPSAMPMCVNVTGQPCALSSPNLAFGTHCNV